VRWVLKSPFSFSFFSFPLSLSKLTQDFPLRLYLINFLLLQVKPEKDSEEKGKERESERETTFCLLNFLSCCWTSYCTKEKEMKTRERDPVFLGLLLSFFSPSHGLSLSRSVSLCLSARESKGKNGKEGEQRRKKKEGENLQKKDEKRRWKTRRRR
jgi:hypothetical protein